MNRRHFFQRTFGLMASAALCQYLPAKNMGVPANTIDLHLANGDWIARMEAFENHAYGDGTHIYVWTHCRRFFRVEGADQLWWRVYEWQTNVWACQSDSTGCI